MKARRKNKLSQDAQVLGDQDSNLAANLVTVDKLLATAAKMMAGAPMLDRGAFEYLRRLRVAVRFAISAKEREINKEASHRPTKWAERSNKNESPIDFIRREYADVLARKSLSRADIRRLDPSLYTAFYAWISKNRKLPDGFDLPKLVDANQRKLKAVGKIKQPRRLLKVSEMSVEDREQLRLYKLSQRQRKAP